MSSEYRSLEETVRAALERLPASEPDWKTRSGGAHETLSPDGQALWQELDAKIQAGLGDQIMAIPGVAIIEVYGEPARVGPDGSELPEYVDIGVAFVDAQSMQRGMDAVSGAVGQLPVRCYVVGKPPTD